MANSIAIRFVFRSIEAAKIEAENFQLVDSFKKFSNEFPNDSIASAWYVPSLINAHTVCQRIVLAQSKSLIKQCFAVSHTVHMLKALNVNVLPMELLNAKVEVNQKRNESVYRTALHAVRPSIFDLVLNRCNHSVQSNLRLFEVFCMSSFQICCDKNEK